VLGLPARAQQPSGATPSSPSDLPPSAVISAPADTKVDQPVDDTNLAINPTREGIADTYNPKLGHYPILFDYHVDWYPKEPVKQKLPTDAEFLNQSFGVASPVWQNASDEFVALSTFDAALIRTNALLPLTRKPIPDALYDVELGTNYRHLFENGWIGGVNLRGGSASNEPFDNVDQLTWAISAFLQLPVRQHDALIINVNFSNNTDFWNRLPVPGIAYLYQPNDWFLALVGVPYAKVVIRPRDDVTFELDYAWLHTVHGRLTYLFAPNWWVYAGYDWQDQGFFLADSRVENDRLFYAEQRLLGGLGMQIANRFFLDVSGGYAFDRFFWEGIVFHDHGIGRVDIGNGPFVGLNLHMRF
jgi:hypothetical protein